MITLKMHGLEAAINKLNNEIKEIEDNTQKGITSAAVFIKGKALDITPHDLGNLKGSAFIVTQKSKIDNNPSFKAGIGKSGRVSSVDVGRLKQNHSSVLEESKKDAESADGPVAVIGYSAYYAAEVHEIPKRKYTSPGTGPKFLERTIKEHSPKILEIIKRHVKGK